MIGQTLSALVLGLLEGLTEFLPVSSTGHILLAGYFLGFESAGKTFEVVIQLGAILAVVLVYLRKIVGTVAAIPSDPQARRFALSVIVAFLPAMVAGALLHDVIKGVLFESPRLIATALIVGGLVLLVVDRLRLTPRHDAADRFPLGMALVIGLAQTVALIPGVSRSGSTIVAALLMGSTKRAAAEFSFFLAIPTMIAAFTFDLWSNRNLLDAAAVWEIATGFAAAFATAILVVRWLLGFVSRHGFALFAWWRIIVGSVVLAALAMGS